MFSIFPIASPKHDNAGGIAASVIVMLLLVGTLIALLIYYLRTRPEVGSGAGPSSSSSSARGGFSNDIYEPDLTVSRSHSQTFKNAEETPCQISAMSING